MELLFEDVFQLTGVHEKATVSQPLSSIAGKFTRGLMLVTWERCSYLGVELKFVESNNPRKVIDGEIITLRRTLEEVTGKYAKLAQDVLDGEVGFLACEVTGGDEFSVHVRCDANSPDFAAADRVSLANGQAAIELNLGVLIYLSATDIDPPSADPQASAEITVRISPASKPGPYHEVVALDFGNTTSTMVCMRPDTPWLKREHESRVFDVVHADPDSPRDESIFSALKVGRLPDPPTEDLYANGECRIGTFCVRTDGESAVLGAKQMVTDPDKTRTYFLRTNDGDFEVAKTAPAQLYIKKMIQGFIRERKTVPQKLSITYPTTYSHREARELRETVFHALRMAVGQRERPQVDPESLLERIERVIPNPIDEASAAAAYLLVRDNVLVPGAIPAFCDQYPQGLHALVFDCGGGTTDIALVKVDGSRRFDEHTKREFFSLSLKVVGRTGARRFGGDEITLAVFRILKAKLALHAAPLLGLRVDLKALPDSPEKWPGYLQENDQEISKIIDTKFRLTGQRLSAEDVRLRRKATLELWLLAEQMKIKAAQQEDPVSIQAVGGGHDTGCVNALSNLFSRRSSAASTRLGAFERAFQATTVSRAEIDAVIGPALEETVKKMDRLVQEKLGSGVRPTPGNEFVEVERVYLVGNAARYPLVAQFVQKFLKVRFLKQRLRPADAESKWPVVKGACVVNWLLNNNSLFTTETDKDLFRRLPYDIVLSGLGSGRAEKMYHENELCDRLPKRLIPVPPAAEGVPPYRRIELFRRWPGDRDRDISLFMVFDFPEPLRGPVELRFDEWDQTFVMRDLYGDDVRGREVVETDHVSHVESGVI